MSEMHQNAGKWEFPGGGGGMPHGPPLHTPSIRLVAFGH